MRFFGNRIGADDAFGYRMINGFLPPCGEADGRSEKGGDGAKFEVRAGSADTKRMINESFELPWSTTLVLEAASQSFLFSKGELQKIIWKLLRKNSRAVVRHRIFLPFKHLEDVLAVLRSFKKVDGSFFMPSA